MDNNKLADRKRMMDITSSRDDFHHNKGEYAPPPPCTFNPIDRLTRENYVSIFCRSDSSKHSLTHKTRLKELEDEIKLREVSEVYILALHSN